MLINTGNISRKVLSKVLRSFDKNFERLQQEYILYYDTMRQLEARKCPEDCIEHSDNYKISINEWNELRKKIHAFGNEVDETQKKLQKIEAETN